jgi:hypothetical protein
LHRREDFDGFEFHDHFVFDDHCTRKAASTISLAMAFSVIAAFNDLSPSRQDAKNAVAIGRGSVCVHEMEGV